ncbi:gag-pol polyprotein, partial [Tanacetum coccineum]
MPLPGGRKPIGNKWVYKIKRNGDDQVEGYRARLVVKGNAQKEGIDFNEIFSHVVSPSNKEERMEMSRVLYASAVGSLMFAMICTRSDIAHVVGVNMQVILMEANQPLEVEYVTVAQACKEAALPRRIVMSVGNAKELVRELELPRVRLKVLEIFEEKWKLMSTGLAFKVEEKGFKVKVSNHFILNAAPPPKEAPKPPKKGSKTATKEEAKPAAKEETKPTTKEEGKDDK